MTTLDQIIDQVSSANGVKASAAALVHGLAVLIAEAGTQPHDLHRLTGELSENADKIADAVAGRVPKQEPAKAPDGAKTDTETKPGETAVVDEKSEDGGANDPTLKNGENSPSDVKPTDKPRRSKIAGEIKPGDKADHTVQKPDPARNTSEAAQEVKPGIDDKMAPEGNHAGKIDN